MTRGKRSVTVRDKKKKALIPIMFQRLFVWPDSG